MIMTKKVFARLMQLLAQDTLYFASAPEDGTVKIALIGESFTPTEDIEFSDLTLLAGHGLDAKTYQIEAHTVIRSRITGNYGLKLQEPEEGTAFVVNALDDLPKTAYGVVIYFKPAAGPEVVLATKRFDEPVQFAAVGDYVDVTAVLGFVSQDEEANVQE